LSTHTVPPPRKDEAVVAVDVNDLLDEEEEEVEVEVNVAGEYLRGARIVVAGMDREEDGAE